MKRFFLLLFTAACGDDATTVDAGAPDAGAPDAAFDCPTGMTAYPFVEPDFEGASAAFPPSNSPGRGGLPFLWGSATAAHQVEGGNTESDWWQWEQMGRAHDQSSDEGPNHWEHYAEDFDRAQSDGMNAYRMGIEWAKLFPTRESFETMTPDPIAVQHYHDVLGALRDREIIPMVTLHHFVSPIWWSDPRLPAEERKTMGWASDRAVEDFERFARWAATEYGAEVDLWITINEPLVNVIAGYGLAQFPPGLSYNPAEDLLVRVTINQVFAHAKAFDAIHDADTTDVDGDDAPALVSIAHHMRVFFGDRPCVERDWAAAERLRYLNNQIFLDAIVDGNLDRNADGDYDDDGDMRAHPELVGRADFIGLNYYGLSLVNADIRLSDLLPGIPQIIDRRTDRPKSDLEWTIYPGGFRTVLDEAAAYGLPIYITENGVADQGGVLRSTFLIEHLHVLATAIADGIDVRGYFHWSLMDNFEWAEGYCPRFGLYRIDYDDPARTRTETPGLLTYRRIIAEGMVAEDLLDNREPYGAPTVCD
jgi:beta-glucosidase